MSDHGVLELGDIAPQCGMTAGETDLSFTVLTCALIELLQARV